tara:strand:- start:165 stop:302 length:138 start_codon:yes stop_codon:yes gene_type:complete
MATNHRDEDFFRAIFVEFPRPDGWDYLSDTEQRFIEAEEEHEANA